MSSPRLSHHLLNIPASSRSFATSARVGAGLSALARPVAEKITAEWKGTSMIGGTTKNFIGGQFVESKADKWLEVHDPVGYAMHPCQLILFINPPSDP